jgi:HlyD family secretion protein
MEALSQKTIPTETNSHTEDDSPPNRKRRIRPYHVAGLVLLLLALSILGYAFYPSLIGQNPQEERKTTVERPNAEAQIEAVNIMPMAFPIRIEATGHLAAWQSAELSADIGGVILKRTAEEGAYAGQGSLLFQLDDREYRLALKEAESELMKARTTYVTNTIGDTQTTIDTSIVLQARRQLTQAERAFAKGHISQEEMQNARRRFEANKMLSGQQKGTVQAVISGVVQAEHRVERSQLNLSYTQIKAPFSGRISNLQVEAGQRISGGQKLLTLEEDSRMKVSVDVLEADLLHLEVGASALIRIPSLNNEVYNGTIHSINPTIDPQKGMGRVTVALNNPDHRLLSGTFAYVALETRRLQGAMVVPADAVLVRQGRNLVFVIKDNKAQWVYVTTGIRSGNTIEITEGLHAGDLVAVAGHFALAHDAPVRVTRIRPMKVE